MKVSAAQVPGTSESLGLEFGQVLAVKDVNEGHDGQGAFLRQRVPIADKDCVCNMSCGLTQS